jgi:ribonuclease P protein subunit POP4
MRTKENLPMHELVGLRLRVVRSSDGGREGMEGVVVDETQRTLVVRVGGRELRLPKHGCAFEVTLEDGTAVVLEGDDIAYRPEDRTKRSAVTRRGGRHG